MTKPSSNWRPTIPAKFHPVNFKAPFEVEIPYQQDVCREQLADDLRLWCAANCAGRWRPIARWTETGVKIAFENHDDAAIFRLSH